GIPSEAEIDEACIVTQQMALNGRCRRCKVRLMLAGEARRVTDVPSAWVGRFAHDKPVSVEDSGNPVWSGLAHRHLRLFSGCDRKRSVRLGPHKVEFKTSQSQQQSVLQPARPLYSGIARCADVLLPAT